MTEIYGKNISVLTENEKVLFEKDKELFEQTVERIKLYEQMGPFAVLLGQPYELYEKEINRQIFVGVTLLGLTEPTSSDEGDEGEIFVEKIEESVYGFRKNLQVINLDNGNPIKIYEDVEEVIEGE